MQKEREIWFALEAEKDELAKKYEKLAKSKLGRATLAYWRKKDKMLGRTSEGNE